MTKPLKFSQASIRRAAAGAIQAGLRIAAIRPDGTLVIARDGDQAGLACEGVVTQTAPHTLPDPSGDVWGDVEA